MLRRLKKLMSVTSTKRYVNYLRDSGVIVGENTSFLSPIRSTVDIGRAAFIKIGSNCVICSGVSIIAHDYSWSILRKSHGEIIPTGGGTIEIGDNCFIGSNSVILRNVKIGDNVIVGAGSVVSKSIESNTVCAGNPAKVIMTIDDYYQKRKEKLLDEARMNAMTILEAKGKLPTINDMGNFTVLFLPRTPENINHYIRKTRLGDDSSEFEKTFLQTKPMFSSYEAFLCELLGEEIFNRYTIK
jgi:acetyltransferase-like isoleucine patch superfamily enzyme